MPQYISLLRKLYADQQATALTDTDSDMFEITRERNKVTTSIVEVLPAKACAKYLGQTITFEQKETT